MIDDYDQLRIPRDESGKAREVAWEDKRVEHQPVLDQCAKGRRKLGADEPVVVGNVLHHRAQANQRMLAREPRDRRRSVGRGKVDPADDARDRCRFARQPEQKFGFGHRRRDADAHH